MRRSSLQNAPQNAQQNAPQNDRNGSQVYADANAFIIAKGFPPGFLDYCEHEKKYNIFKGVPDCDDLTYVLAWFIAEQHAKKIYDSNSKFQHDELLNVGIIASHLYTLQHVEKLVMDKTMCHDLDTLNKKHKRDIMLELAHALYNKAIQDYASSAAKIRMDEVVQHKNRRKNNTNGYNNGNTPTLRTTTSNPRTNTSNTRTNTSNPRTNNNNNNTSVRSGRTGDFYLDGERVPW